MMNIKGIFAVSLIAMVAMVAGAHTSNAVAAIASQGYVDQQVGSKLSSISGSTTGSGNVVTSVSASGSTVSVTKGITAEETKNKVKSVRAASSATDTAYPSEKAVATALAGKVATAQGPAAANKAVITDTSGNIITGQIASGMIADDAVTSAKLAAGAVDANALAAGAVTSAKIADGTIVNADIAANAAIATSKISGLAKVATSGLYGDLTGTPTVNNATLTIQKNGSTVDTFTANASANKTINITVPTQTSQLTNNSGFITADDLPVATANTLGGVKSGGDITVDTSGAVTVNSASRADSATTATNAKTAATDAEGNNIILTYATKDELPAASDILTTTTVTSSGTGAVLTGVSVTAGKVTLQKGNVQIPSGGKDATSYVSIWVE